MSKPKSKKERAFISVSADRSMLDQLDALAERNFRTRSQEVKRIIADELSGVNENTALTETRVIVRVYKGVVTSVKSTSPNISLAILDEDNAPTCEEETYEMAVLEAEYQKLPWVIN